MEYKQTKVKAAVKLYRNKDPTLQLVREFEEHASIKGHPLLVKEAQCYTNEMGISLDLSHLQPVCKDRDGKDISCEKVKNELKVAAKEIGQDKMRTRNGKESYSPPEKKTKVWLERCVLSGYGSGLSVLFTQWQECMSSTSIFYRLSFSPPPRRQRPLRLMM